MAKEKEIMTQDEIERVAEQEAAKDQVEKTAWEDQVIDPAIVEAFEKEDISSHLPGDIEMEIFAGELLMYLTEYHKTRLATRIARSNGDHRRAKELGETMVHCRNAAALIQHTYGQAVIDRKNRIAEVRMRALKRQQMQAMED